MAERGNAECGRRNAEGGMRKAECGRGNAGETGKRKPETGNAERGMRKAEGGTGNAPETGNRKCGMRGASFALKAQSTSAQGNALGNAIIKRKALKWAQSPASRARWIQPIQGCFAFCIHYPGQVASAPRHCPAGCLRQAMSLRSIVPRDPGLRDGTPLAFSRHDCVNRIIFATGFTRAVREHNER